MHDSFTFFELLSVFFFEKTHAEKPNLQKNLPKRQPNFPQEFQNFVFCVPSRLAAQKLQTSFPSSLKGFPEVAECASSQEWKITSSLFCSQ